MKIDELVRINPEKLLSYLGINYKKIGANTYNFSIREEKNPSAYFYSKFGKYYFKDFGLQIPNFIRESLNLKTNVFNIIDFYRVYSALFLNKILSGKEAVQELSNIYNLNNIEYNNNNNLKDNYIIKNNNVNFTENKINYKIIELTNNCIRYLNKRGITDEIIEKAKNIYTCILNNREYLAFKNSRGNYTIRSINSTKYYRNLGKNSYTELAGDLKNSSKVFYICESAIDTLSLLEILKINNKINNLDNFSFVSMNGKNNLNAVRDLIMDLKNFKNNKDLQFRLILDADVQKEELIRIAEILKVNFPCSKIFNLSGMLKGNKDINEYLNKIIRRNRNVRRINLKPA